jgi:hypothetical protein
MTLDIQRVLELEQANYAALVSAAQASKGNVEVIIRDNVILNSSPGLPLPDSNHACLLRATPDRAETLLDEVLAYFKTQDVPPAFFLSPACTPADWPKRLQARGFSRQSTDEIWIAYDEIQRQKAPPLSPSVTVDVQLIGPTKALDFASVFARSFDLPPEMVPMIAGLLEPSIGLPGYYHYLAIVSGQAVGCCSMIDYQRYGIIGSMGLLSTQRGGRIAYNFVLEVAKAAQARGVDCLLGQTTSKLVARLLCLYGFKTVFARSCYTLNDTTD